MDMEDKQQQLMERLTKNYDGYKVALLRKDRQELIDGAEQIAGTAAVFRHMSRHSYSEQELDYLLQFQNPLEVITDHWPGGAFQMDSLDAIIADVVDRKRDLPLYPLAADPPGPTPDSLHKFLDVDLSAILPQIMEQKTAFYQTDLSYALDEMRQGILSDDPAERNFILMFRQSGVECLNERDVMIAGTRSYNTCQYYHNQTREQVLVYSVELIGNGEKGLRGNLYQQDQHQLAVFAKRASSFYTEATIKFFGGKEVRVPEKEYNSETISELKYRYGDIEGVRHEADDESVVQGALRREHNRRERLPEGHIPVHRQNLEEARIQTEVERITAALQSLEEPNAPDKTHFMVEVSPYFLPLASENDLYQVFNRVQKQLKQPMYISRANGEKRPAFFMGREERSQEQTQKPSIKEQLAAKPVPSQHQAEKPRAKEVR